MKFYRMGLNECEIEFSDYELEEMADIIEHGLEHLEEYNDLKRLKEHDKDYYLRVAKSMRKYARYE